MNRGNTAAVSNTLHGKVEIRRVDTDQHVGWISKQPLLDLTPDAKKPRKMPNDFKQAHYGEFLAIKPCPATLRSHQGSGYAFKLNSGIYFPDRPNQARAELIAGGFSRNDDNPGHGLPVSNLADNAALGTAKKLHQNTELGLIRKLLGELLQCLRRAQTRAVEKFISLLEVLYLTL